MVRHKTRWFLVRLDYARDMVKAQSSRVVGHADSFPTKKELAIAIRESLVSCFGQSSTTEAAREIQVRLSDLSTRLAMIRVPRQFHTKIRASITFMTAIGGKRLVASVISVNGSARTAKLATIRHIRSIYRERILLQQQMGNGHESMKLMEESCKQLNDLLAVVSDIY